MLDTELDTEVKETTPAPPEEWTQERLSGLVGLPDARGRDDNVLSQAEFFSEDDDPHAHQSQRGFSSSPWAKGGLVFGVIGVGSLVFGFMLTDIFNGSQQKKSQPENPPTEQVVFEEEEPNQEGHLKTQLALDDQAERMKEIEQSRSPKTKLELKDVEDKKTSPSVEPYNRSISSRTPRTGSHSPSSPPVRTRTVRVPVRTETGVSSRLPPPSRTRTPPLQSERPVPPVRSVEPLNREPVPARHEKAESIDSFSIQFQDIGSRRSCFAWAAA